VSEVKTEKKRKLPFGFGRAKKRAEKAAASPEKTERIIADALKKADRQRGRLSKVWDEINGLFRLVRAWVRRDYKSVPWESVVLALGAIVYFLSPIDLIPDFILGLGYLDDAAFVAWVVQSIRGDIKEFLAWEAAGGATDGILEGEDAGEGDDVSAS